MLNEIARPARLPCQKENAAPRARLTLPGAIERLSVSESGHYLVLGWLDDEGGDTPRLSLVAGERTAEIPAGAVLRHARRDVERRIRGGAYDSGFIAFGRSASPTDLKRPLVVDIRSNSQALTRTVVPSLVSDARLLDTLLVAATGAEMHGGSEVALHHFLSGPGGVEAQALFQRLVDRGTASYQVERFGARAAARSFVTVLFGKLEAVMLQPVLFLAAGIEFGEWVYVCNSPEDATTVLRFARVISVLHDVMITVVVMGGNVGFGAANNVGVSEASGRDIYLVNPDVYPAQEHAGALQRCVTERNLGDVLWGGLLFYDHATLMHAGMYMEADAFGSRAALNRRAEAPLPPVNLLRVEHFSKGIPFAEALWELPRIVPAVTGAAMAFRRSAFERVGGFSTRYIYGHYEDADLSLRWAEVNGPVAVDPNFRLIHLEGQGSRGDGAPYRAAAAANRHLFTLRHGAAHAAAARAAAAA